VRAWSALAAVASLVLVASVGGCALPDRAVSDVEIPQYEQTEAPTKCRAFASNYSSGLADSVLDSRDDDTAGGQSGRL
jgi:hypothetical protein